MISTDTIYNFQDLYKIHLQIDIDIKTQSENGGPHGGGRGKGNW